MSTVAVVSFGNGKHTALLSTEQQEGAVFWTTIAFCPGVLSFCLPKLAVVVLLIRILHPGPFHRCFLWTMVILCQLSFIGAMGILLGRCRPTRAIWDFSVQGTCLDISILVNYGLAVTGGRTCPSSLRGPALISSKPTRLLWISIWLFIHPSSSFAFRCP